MNTDRRLFFRLAASAVFAPVLPRAAAALDYPTRPVRTIVGFAPGGPGDTVMRVTNQWLAEKFGQQFFIENRPGAGTSPILDDELLSEPFRQPLGDETRRDVVRTSGGKADDNVNRPGRIGFRHREPRERQRGAADSCAENPATGDFAHLRLQGMLFDASSSLSQSRGRE